MLSSVFAWLSSCTLQDPQRPLAALTADELARASVVVHDKRDPAGTYLVDDAAVLAANAEAVVLRDGKLNMAGSGSARFEVHVFVDGRLRSSAHASTTRGLELGTLPAAGTPVELEAETLGRDAYRDRRAALLAQGRIRFLSDPQPLAADVLTHETSVALPPLVFATAGEEVPATRLRAAQDSIRRRAARALDAAGVHPYTIVAPEDITARGPQAVAERGGAPDANGRPAPLRAADGAPLLLPGVHAAYAHLVVQTYAADAGKVAALDPSALTASIDDGAAVDDALAALATQHPWPPGRLARLDPVDVVAWEEAGGPKPETRELTWLLLYFRPR